MPGYFQAPSKGRQEVLSPAQNRCLTDRNIAQRDVCQAVNAVDHFIHRSIATQHDNIVTLMVRGDLSDDLGGVLLVFCKIYLVGDASFLQNGLDIIPYLMPQPGAALGLVMNIYINLPPDIWLWKPLEQAV